MDTYFLTGKVQLPTEPSPVQELEIQAPHMQDYDLLSETTLSQSITHSFISVEQ